MNLVLQTGPSFIQRGAGSHGLGAEGLAAIGADEVEDCFGGLGWCGRWPRRAPAPPLRSAARRRIAETPAQGDPAPPRQGGLGMRGDSGGGE